MKKSVGLFTLLIVMALALPIQALAKGHGVFRVVKGDVKIIKGDSGKEKKAKIGQKVYPKDTVVTGKSSRAKIVMVDKNVLNVSPESKIEISSYEFEPKKKKKNVLLNVLYGKVRSKVKQKYDGKGNKFQVKTKSAVAGVRGTDFLTSYNPSTNQSQVVTFEGKVEFGAPGPGGIIQNPVSVGAGQLADRSSGSSSGQVRAVPKQQLAAMDSESNADTASDNGSGGERQPSNSPNKSNDKNDDAGGDNKAEGDKGGDNKAGGDAKAEGDKGGGDKGGDSKAGGNDSAGGGDAKAEGDQAGGADAKGDGADGKAGGSDAKSEGGKPGRNQQAGNQNSNEGGGNKGGANKGPAKGGQAGNRGPGGARGRAPAAAGGAPTPESNDGGGGPAQAAGPGPADGQAPAPRGPAAIGSGPGALPPPPPMDSAQPLMPDFDPGAGFDPVLNQPVAPDVNDICGQICNETIVDTTSRLIINIQNGN